MEKFQYKDYTICVYLDIIEFAKEFFDIQEGAELDDEVSHVCHGMADPFLDEINIYIPEMAMIRSVWTVVAHELGHIVDFDHGRYPAIITEDMGDAEEIAERQEKRAEFFENFFLDVLNISDMIINVKDDYYARQFYDQHIPLK